MKTGKLYIIATPIGNLEDITIRALNTLRDHTDYIYCEDTRQTKKLLTRFEIRVPTRSLHSNSPDSKYLDVISQVKKGNSVAYITDSGTPGISDPGSKLIRFARSENIPIVPLPGASALSAIISISGFPGKNIFFAGFLSKQKGKRRKELERFKDYRNVVIIIFESPYRIKRLIGEIFDLFPESDLVIAREISKVHEEIIAGRVDEIYEKIDSIKELGEFTVAVYNK